MDFEEHKKRQARARDLGMDYARIREIITSVHSDDEDGISMGRAVEEIRELALTAAEKAVEEERKATLHWIRRMGDWVEDGEHRKEIKP
jgi:hypothetical protein